MDLFNNFLNQPPPEIYLLITFVWSIFWKGIALWRSAVSEQRNWFIALLVLNTLGILEIVYLFKFAKRTLTLSELKSWLPTKTLWSS